MSLAASLSLLVSCTTVGTGPSGSAADVGRATLPNGLRVVVVRDPLAPVVTQQISYFVGANESPSGFPGMAHAQEHMMFRGSPGLSGDQLSEISAELGGQMDAFTTSNITSYYFTVPADAVDVALRIGAIRMAGVDDSQADWEKERGAIEQEVARDNSQPFYVLYSKALARLFAGTPYEQTGLGTKSSFDATTAAMLREFHDGWYAPNNALLVITGDVEPQSVLSRVRELYGSIPTKQLPTRPVINLPDITAETFSSQTDQPYGMVAICFRMPGYRSADYPAANILARVLDSQRGAIAALSYDGKALGSGFQMNTMQDAGVGLAYAVFPADGDAALLEKQLKEAIVKTISGGIAEDLVSSEQRQLVLENNLERNSVSGLAQAWTNAIALRGAPSPDAAVAALERVTLPDVAAAAKELDFSHAVTLVLTPTPGTKPIGGGQGFGTPESFSSIPTTAVSLPDWASNALAKLPDPKPLFHPTVYTLANGIRLIVQPLSVSHSVSLFGSVRTNEGIQAPKGQEGVGELLDSLFDWGPVGMTRLQFETAVAALGAEISPGTSFSLAALPQYFDATVKLLASDLLNPALPQDALASQRGLLAQETAGRLKSPLFHFRRAVQTAILPKEDPSLRMATPGSIASLTLSDVRAYYRTIMRPDQTTIVVVGDITPEKAKETVVSYFENWRADGPKPNLDNPSIPLSPATSAFVPDPVRIQNDVVMAETVGLTFNDPDHFALELGNEFLGGGFFASPLYRALRVERGLVYSVDSSISFGRTRSFYELTFGAYPDKVAEAKQIAVRVIRSMIEAPLTERDLHLAKGIGLRNIELASQDVQGLANQWIGYSQVGLPLDQLYVVARHYRGITAAEIQAAFKRYLDPSRLSTVIIGQPMGK